VYTVIDNASLKPDRELEAHMFLGLSCGNWKTYAKRAARRMMNSDLFVESFWHRDCQVLIKEVPEEGSSCFVMRSYEQEFPALPISEPGPPSKTREKRAKKQRERRTAKRQANRGTASYG
jgi:hypothetical protein